jgi:hypothetical protein
MSTQLDGSGNPVGAPGTYGSTYGVGTANSASGVGNTAVGGQSGSYVYQTTTQYVQPTTTTAVYTTTTNQQQQGYSTAGYAGYGTTGYTTTVDQYAPQVVNTVVNTGKEVIKGESRIEYVPFEKKIVEYREQSRVERVPRTRKVTQFREETRVEEVPREVTITDYYAIEYLRQYIPQYIPEKQIEYVAKERKVKKYEYIPVERQIVHYPETPLEAELSAGQVIPGGYAYQASSAYTTGTPVAYSSSAIPAGYSSSSYTTSGPVYTQTAGGLTTGGVVPANYYGTTGYVTGGSGVRVQPVGGDVVQQTTTTTTYGVGGGSAVRQGDTVTYANY